MRELLQIRLESLKSEFQLGQHKLAEQERQSTILRNNLLRISGAIQVLEEELLKAGKSASTDILEDSSPELSAIAQTAGPESTSVPKE